VSDDGIRELLAKSFIIIRDFIATELNDDPIGLLGDATWSTLLEENEVYAREQAKCREAMDQVDWKYPSAKQVSAHIRCRHCGSELIRPINPDAVNLEELRFRCIACSLESEWHDVIEEAVSDCFFADSYIAMTDGGDQPVADCHVCGKATFLIAEGRCLACCEALEYTECAICHEMLGPDDQENHGLCGYHAWQAQKDD